MKSPLRQAREKRGLTLKEVADAVAMDPGNLSRIERGEQIPSKDLVDALIQFFESSVNELEIIYPERYREVASGKSSDRRESHDRRAWADRRAAERKAAAAAAALKATP